MEKAVRAVVVAVSDTCSSEKAVDVSGRLLKTLLETNQSYPIVVQDYIVIPDNYDVIVNLLTELSSETAGVDAVITTGGTGFGVRDVTPEAVRTVIEKRANGLETSLITHSLKSTPMAALSRLVCGVRKHTAIISLPGSSKAVQECWDVVAPILEHVVDCLRDDQCKVKKSHKQMNNDRVTIKSAVEVVVAERPRKSCYPLLSVKEAMSTIFKHCAKLGVQNMPVAQSLGFVTAEDVLAEEPIPAFRASIKDGYAVLASDGCGIRKVISSQSAGDTASLTLESQTCVRVSTGAPVPDNCDAVVQVEDTELAMSEGNEEKTVRILKTPTVGQDIRPVGCDLAMGECALSKGTRITSAELGILASIGKTTVTAFVKPTVAVLSTGNELQRADTSPLPPGKVRDSNSVLLVGLLRGYGFFVHNVGIVNDDADQICAILQQAFALADVVLTSGGVSMGEKDLVKQVLEKDLNFQIHFGRVFMKPGKPTTFASGSVGGRKKLLFGLPGNPVSAWVTAHLYVVPALYRVSGLDFSFPEVNVKFRNDYRLDERPEYCRARLVPYESEEDAGLPSAELVDTNQVSSRLVSTRNANLLLMFPPKSQQKTHLRPGDIVRAMVIGT